MTPRSPTLTIILAVTMLASVVAAGGANFHADLTATSLQADESAHLTGPLVALLQEGDGATNGYSLRAPAVVMETDNMDPSVHAVVVKPQVADATTTREPFTDAWLEGVALRPNYRWNLFSLDSANPAQVEVSASCATAEASEAESLSRLPLASAGRPLTTRDTATAQVWTCVDGASVRVKGDLLLSLWTADATLYANGTVRELRSGPEQSSYAPTGPDLSGAVSRDVELFFFITNGTLTVPSLTGSYTLLTGDRTVLSAPTLTLQGSTGVLDVDGRDVALMDSAVKITGQADATLSGVGVNRPLLARVVGSADAVAVDGRALAITTAVPDGGLFPLPWWAYALAVLAVALLARLYADVLRPVRAYYRFATEGAGGLTVSQPRNLRERRGAGYAVLGGNALLTGRTKTAGRHADRARHLFPRSLDAKILEAVVVEKAGQLERALELHVANIASLPEDARDDRASLACHVARLLVKLKRHDDAVIWLKKAAAANVLIFEREIMDKAFDPLLDHPWFDGARMGQVSREILRRGYDASFA